MIDPSAQIDPGAVIGQNVRIGPFSVIEKGVVMGDDCRLGSHVVLRQGTILGAGSQVHAGAVLGGEPQDLRFDPALESGVVIGAESIIREGVTVNRSTKPGHHTLLGKRVFLMANSHVGHDGDLGDGVILANNVMLAGHVSVGAHTFIGGGAGIHQFVRIGTGVMVGGHASITRDIPPYLMVAERDRIAGLNSIGCRRRGMDRSHLALLKDLLRAYGRSPAAFRDGAAARLEEEGWEETHPGAVFLRFFVPSKRGICPYLPTQAREREEEG